MGSQRVRHNWATNTHINTLQSKVQRGTVIIVLFWNVLYFCTLLLYDFHPVSKTSVKEENHFGWLSCLFLFSTLTFRYFRLTYSKECEINNTLQNPWASPIELQNTLIHLHTRTHTHTRRKITSSSTVHTQYVYNHLCHFRQKGPKRHLRNSAPGQKEENLLSFHFWCWYSATESKRLLGEKIHRVSAGRTAGFI